MFKILSGTAVLWWRPERGMLWWLEGTMTSGAGGERNKRKEWANRRLKAAHVQLGPPDW